MKLLKYLVPLIAIPFLCSVSAQVPEIANPQLNDIAMVQSHPQYGAIIIYNPILCQQIGAACGFFRAHEYGHIKLNHKFLHPGTNPAIREAQADQWAATYGIPQEILAAYYLFLNGGSSSNSQVYGTSQERAARLRQYAIQAGNWIGP